MEAHYRAFQGRLIIKVEGSNIKELFEQIGPVAEVLDGDDACGKCASLHIYPRAREAQGFTYYELVCSDCGARLSFGQHKVGDSLWAKRSDERGRLLDNRGWSVYLGLAAPPPQQSAPRQAAPAPSSPKAQAATDDPALVGFLTRGAATDDLTGLLGELCDVVRLQHGDTKTDAAYIEAIRLHGNPMLTTEGREGVIRHLWIASLK